MVNKDEMKREAIRRMEMLGIHDVTIRQFKEENLLSYSIMGVNYWFNEEHKQIIERFEKEQNCLVYYGILNKETLAPTLSLFYVSNFGEDLDYRKEWIMDRQEISEGQCLAYVHNFDEEHFSEIGYISFKPLHGGLRRLF